MDLELRVKITEPPDPQLLREWWHSVLRKADKTRYFAVVLVLPADKEMLDYLIEFRSELDIISGEDCLVMFFSEDQAQRQVCDVSADWQFLVREHIREGHSKKIADLFGIGFDQFPCLVLFSEVRSPEHALVTFKDMTKEEIASQMRLVFAIVHSAVLRGEDPLRGIEHFLSREKAKGVFNGQVRRFTEKTLEIVMEAWIKALFK